MIKGTSADSLLQLSTRILRDLVDGHSAHKLAVLLCEEAEKLSEDRVATLFKIDDEGHLHLFATAAAKTHDQQKLHESIKQNVVGQHCSVLDCQHVLVVDKANAPTACTSQCILTCHANWSCWAYPVLDGDTVVGTFALSAQKSSHPTAQDARMLDLMASIAGMLLCFDKHTQTQKIQTSKLLRLADFQGMLGQANTIVASSSTQDELLKALCACVVQHGHLSLAWISRPDAQEQFQMLAAAGTTGYLEGLSVSARAELPEGCGSMGTAWRQGCPIFSGSFHGSIHLLPWAQRAEYWGLKASAALPIFRAGRIWAILTVIHSEEDIFDQPLRNLLEELARNLSRGLDRLDQLHQEQRLSAIQGHLLNNTRAGITMVRNRHFVQVNQRFAEILGYASPDEFSGLSTRMIYPSSSEYDQIGQMYAQQTLGENNFFETRLLHKSGHSIPCEVSFGILHDHEGELSIWTLVDVSDREERERERNSYRDQLLRYADRIPGMLYKFCLHPDGHMSFPIALGAVQEMLGVQPQDIENNAAAAFQRAHPDDLPDLVNSIFTSARTMTLWHFECRLQLPDGRMVWRTGSSLPEREANGDIAWYGFISDTTEQKQALAALASSEQQQRAIFDASPTAMAVLNPSTLEIQAVNAAWETLLHRSADSIMGHNLLTAGIWSRALDNEKFQAQLRTSSPTIPYMEVTLLTQDGQPILCRVTAATTPVGEHHVLIMIAEDISEQRRIEAEIRDLNRDLEYRVQERTQDLENSNTALQASINELETTQEQLVEVEKLSALGHLVTGVAHEINTPLGNGLLAASTIVSQLEQLQIQYEQGLTRRDFEDFMEQAGLASDIVVRNLRRAADLVQSFKQVAVDQNIMSRRHFELHLLVRDLLVLLHPRLRISGVEVVTQIEPFINMDSYPGPLGQIITNLITNSLDHAFEESVSAKQLSISAVIVDKEWVEISIRDNGCGIPADHLAHIFEPFFTTRLGRGGSGLGLHISHNAALVLGGRLRVNSIEGQGSCFVLRVPLNAPSVTTA
ncbi:MAG: PAS domain S-box protein [Pseudomonadales bacterium]|nr:PAS domain S-box protein [Pseudomonadales bacterium]